MKKTMCLLLCVVLAAGMFLPASADSAESVTAERLILVAKEKLSVDDAVMEFQNYYLNETEHGRLYSFYWKAKDENIYRTIRASLNEEGIISEYHLYEDRDTSRLSFAKYSGEEAIAAAKTFINTIDPEKLAETEVLEVEIPSYGEYQVVFQRMHKGIPVAGNVLSCSVNSDTLQITGYSAAWEELTFPEGEAISLAEAEHAFSEQLGYALFYQIVSENYENSARLIYRSRFDETVFIDGFTGQAVSYEKALELYRSNAKATNEAVMDSADGVQLSPEERALVEQVSQMLSQEEADRIARRVPEFGITKDFQLENYSISRQQTGEYVIGLSYQYNNAEDDIYCYKTVTIHAESGQVLDFYSHEAVPYSQKAESGAISADTLKQKATSFLEKYYAEEYAQMVEKHTFSQSSDSFAFLRLVNGTLVYNNGASLTYDAVSGNLLSFSLDWAETIFPEIAKVQPLAAANEKAMEKGEFSLKYMSVTDGEEQTTVLVYGLESFSVLDGVTLESLDYRLHPIADSEVPQYTDLEGYYGKAQIERLLANGIYLEADENNCLRPDEPITQQDFLLLLDRVVWNGRYAADLENLYRYLVRQQILMQEEISPKSVVKRIDGISWLLSALGYGEFVKIPGIFRCPFGDVAEQEQGVAAVAWGLKLVVGDGGGTFRPNMALRRGDAMMIVHNYMEK